ncbi:MAG: PKD domain-containing protein, partial [Bacteroidota bacterium]
MKLISYLIWLFVTLPIYLVAQIIDIAYTENLCIDERLSIKNQSAGFSEFQWDFCPGDLAETPSAGFLTNSSILNGPFSVELLYDNNWLGFFPSRNGDLLYRADFGSDLKSILSLDLVPVSNGLLNGPISISFLDSANHSFCYLVNRDDGKLIRLDFGDDLTSTPIATDLSDFGQISLADGIKSVTDSIGSHVLLVTYGQNVGIVNLGDAPSGNGSFSSFSISGSSRLFGIDVINYEGNWYGLATSFGNGAVYHIDFGTRITNSVTFNELPNNGNSLGSPADIKFIKDGPNYYALMQSRSGSLFLYNFDQDPSSISPSITNLGSLGLFENNSSGLDVVKDSSEWIAVNTNFSSNEVNYISFKKSCDISREYVVAESPVVDFNSSGNFIFETSFIGDSITQRLLDTVTVSNDVAPSIAILDDGGQCITSVKTFVPSTDGLLSYSWDFDNDGIVDVTDPIGAEQSFDYSGLGAGTYTVRLDVSDGTCDNFVEEEITIYDPPPVPSFDFSAPRFCTNTEITFSNTTDDAIYSGPVQYTWFLGSEEETMVARDATFSFTTPGEKTITLTSSIPGCEETFQQTVTIAPGPTAAFTNTTICEGESMDFSNGSSDAVSFAWDFGDGFSSIDENPSHVYTEAGNYQVTLRAIDADGCDDTEVIEVVVSNRPQINFDFDVPCTSSDGVLFSDLTTVENADVVSWTWFVDGEQVSTEQNPEIIFNSADVKTIRLDVLGSNGCEASSSEDIEVLTSPNPAFTSSLGCQGEQSVFRDNTESTGNPVTSWLWSVDGVTYTTQDINHVFTDPGTYEVSLEVTGQNFCSEMVTNTIEIVGLPTVDFSISGECDNELIRALDGSTETADIILSRRWLLDGQNVGNGPELFLENLEDNTYDLSLEVETTAGCIVIESQTLEINPSPTTSFTSSRTFGVPGDLLSFSNTSSGGVAYQWLLDGEVQATEPDENTIVFSEAGNYQVSLVGQNSLGCYDTATQEVLIAIPEVD